MTGNFCLNQPQIQSDAWLPQEGGEGTLRKPHFWCLGAQACLRLRLNQDTRKFPFPHHDMSNKIIIYCWNTFPPALENGALLFFISQSALQIIWPSGSDTKTWRNTYHDEHRLVENWRGSENTDIKPSSTPDWKAPIFSTKQQQRNPGWIWSSRYIDVSTS